MSLITAAEVALPLPEVDVFWTNLSIKKLTYMPTYMTGLL
jgi:hypothetical protein